MNGQDPFGTIEKLLSSIARHRGKLSLYAVPLFLWFSTRLFASLRNALNEVFEGSLRWKQQHFLLGYLWSKLRDLGMVGATLLLFGANTALSAGLGILEARSAAAVQSMPVLFFFVTSLGRFVTELLAFGFGVALFFLVYRYATIRRLPWRTALVASTFTALAFEIAKRLFGLYLQYVATVGQWTPDANLGAISLFVLWVYYTAVVFLFGAVVAETWEVVRGRT